MRDQLASESIRAAGTDPATIAWSLNRGYYGHIWKSGIRRAGEITEKPCKDPFLEILRLAKSDDPQRVVVTAGRGTGLSYFMGRILIPAATRDYTALISDREESLHYGAWHALCGIKGMQRSLIGRYHLSVGTSEVKAFTARDLGHFRGLMRDMPLFIGENAQSISPEQWRPIDMAHRGSSIQIVTGTSIGQTRGPGSLLAAWTKDVSTTHIRVDALDHPNNVLGEDVVLGCTSKDYVDEVLYYAQGDTTSDEFVSSIRGYAP